MRVAVTGGTGFVGSHTVATLIEQGHSVRLLVRSPDRVEPALGPHSLDAPEVVVGDVTDRTAVDALIDGCEAVVHSANVYSLDKRRAEEMFDVNVRSTELLLALASTAGLDPIVHVSSYVALLPTDRPLTPTSDAGDPVTPYSRAKAAAERVARRFQAGGAPVVITYPGVVLGPHDPYLGESNRMAMNILKGKFWLANDGPLPVTDVRDLANAHAATMQPGKGPRRYIVIGHNPGFRALVARFGKAAGRSLKSRRVPVTMAFATGRLADWTRSTFGANPSLSHEQPWLLAHTPEVDAATTRTNLGIRFTPLDATLVDTVRWLHQAGHITSRQAGSLGR